MVSTLLTAKVGLPTRRATRDARAVYGNKTREVGYQRTWNERERTNERIMGDTKHLCTAADRYALPWSVLRPYLRDDGTYMKIPEEPRARE